MAIALNITETYLPNQTLSSGWYDGERAITYLSFYLIPIIAIEPGAFNTPTLCQLRVITIKNLIHILDYHVDTFKGMRGLIKLEFVEKHVSHQPMPANLLRPLNEHMETFFYGGAIGNEPVLTNLFGGSKFGALRVLGTFCNGNSRFRLIAAANFSGISALIELHMLHCGIESIEIDAFDQISDTLILLHLTGNSMLELMLDSFRCFLDKWPSHSAKESKNLMFYWLGYMPMRCSMVYYRLRNATMISFGYSLGRLHKMICVNDVHGRNEESQQIIHPVRWRLKHHFIQKYAVRSFRLHFNAVNHSLVVSQSDSDSYRLFVWSINQKISIDGVCPVATWIASNVQCQWRDQSVAIVAIPTFINDSELIGACIIHISMRKQSVPLHCRTIRLADAADDFVFDWMQYGISLLICALILIVIGVIIMKMC